MEIVIFVFVIGLIWYTLKGISTVKSGTAASDYITSHNITVTRQLRYDLATAMIANRIVVDDVKKNIYVFTYSTKNNPACIPYDKLLGYDIFEDSQSVGGIKRAVVGGVLAGGVGAVIGAATQKQKVTSMSFVLYQSGLENPQISLTLIPNKDYTSSINDARQFSIEAGALIKAIMDQNQSIQ